MILTQDEINLKVKNGELFLSRGKLYTASEMQEIEHAERQEQYYDLLQLTKKIQL